MIEVEKSTSKEKGSCNGCSRLQNTTIFHLRFAIRQNGIAIRLCRKCKRELIQKLFETK